MDQHEKYLYDLQGYITVPDSLDADQIAVSVGSAEYRNRGRMSVVQLARARVKGQKGVVGKVNQCGNVLARGSALRMG